MLAASGPLAQPELRVPRGQLVPLARLGLLDPRAIPASQVQQVLLALQARRASRVPLEQRVRQGLRVLRG